MSSPLHHSPSEGCGNSNGEVSEVQLNAAVLSSPDSLHTPISFPAYLNLFSSGLVDSGSSHCFVDPSFNSNNSFASYEIPPISLRLLDRSVGEVIIRAADIPICFSTGDVLPLKFYVTKLDSTSAFVFRHNWLHHYNPSIDWHAGHILHFRHLLHSVQSSSRMGINSSKELPISDLPSASDPITSVSFASCSSSVPLICFSAPSVCFVNAAAYARLARLPVIPFLQLRFPTPKCLAALLRLNP